MENNYFELQYFTILLYLLCKINVALVSIKVFKYTYNKKQMKCPLFHHRSSIRRDYAIKVYQILTMLS